MLKHRWKKGKCRHCKLKQVKVKRPSLRNPKKTVTEVQYLTSRGNKLAKLPGCVEK